jgi:hypothetical protein
LFSFARNEAISVQHLIQAHDIDTLFSLPISLEEFVELLQLQDLLNQKEFTPSEDDSWQFIWGDQRYSSRRYYQMVFANFNSSPAFSLLWKSYCTNRIKFFMCLVLVDRLNTRSMLLRRNFNVQPNAHYVLCQTNVDEDIDHLFFDCPFAQACWSKLGISWNMSIKVCDRVVAAASSNNVNFFMEIFIIAAWEIWNLRNSIIFDNGVASIQRWVRRFKAQGYLHLVRVKEDKHASFISFFETVT